MRNLFLVLSLLSLNFPRAAIALCFRKRAFTYFSKWWVKWVGLHNFCGIYLMENVTRGRGDKTERPWDRFAPPGFESVQPPCILLQLHDASFHCWRHCSGGGKTERKKTREFCMIFFICTVLLNTYLLKFYLHKGKPLLTIPDRLMNNDHSTFLVRDSSSQLVSLLWNEKCFFFTELKRILFVFVVHKVFQTKSSW